MLILLVAQNFVVVFPTVVVVADYVVAVNIVLVVGKVLVLIFLELLFLLLTKL